MSEPRRFRWASIDPWDPDDPAVRRGSEALALTPPPEPLAPPPAPSEDPVPTIDELRQLRALAAAGEPSAIAKLRRAIGRLGRG